MLFQPSNVLPDILSGDGNGTVDLTDGLTVSWQVNGNSLMQKYRIAIFSNDATNTKLYETSNISIAGGFNGVDYQGNPQRFTAATIPEATLADAGITNGNTYKIKLVLYYTLNGVQTNVQQRSMSVFKTRSKPTVEITALTNDTLTTRLHSFLGTYTQAEGDSIAWVRWQLYNNTGEADVASAHEKNLLFDSGRMYGVVDLQFDYDSFLDENEYNLVLSIETENGIQASTSYQFVASWAEQPLPGFAEVSVCKVGNQSTAMKVELSGFSNVIDGDYNENQAYFENGRLMIKSSGDIDWHTFDEFGWLSIADAPWTAITKFTIGSTNDIIQFQTEDADYYLRYRQYTDPGSGYSAYTFALIHDLTVSPYTETVKIMWQTDEADNIWIDPQVKIGTEAIAVLTPTELRIYYDTQEGGLTPSNSLTPSQSLQPSGLSQHNYGMFQLDISEFTQSNLKQIVLYGENSFDYVQVLLRTGEPTLRLLYGLCQRLQYRPKMDGITNSETQDYSLPFTAIVSDFENQNTSLLSYAVNGTVYDGFAVYRQKEGERISQHIADISSLSRYLYDYGCGSKQGKYRYVFYPKGETAFITNGIYSRWFNPCFENWSIIEAELENDKQTYRVLNEFVFGKNFSSGSISNNNVPTVTYNFTRYATVQSANSNYQSGTLSGLIGYIGYVSYTVQSGDTIDELACRFGTTAEQIAEDNPSIDSTLILHPGMILRIYNPAGITSYTDDKQLRDSIWELSTTKNHLFLKSRKGDVIEIRVAGEITMEEQDNSYLQPVSVALPWVQIGDATNKRLIGRVG